MTEMVLDMDTTVIVLMRVWSHLHDPTLLLDHSSQAPSGEVAIIAPADIEPDLYRMMEAGIRVMAIIDLITRTAMSNMDPVFGKDYWDHAVELVVAAHQMEHDG